MTGGLAVVVEVEEVQEVVTELTLAEYLDAVLQYREAVEDGQAR